MFSSIRRSISRKFMVAVMATTFTAVFASGLANLAYDINDFRTSVLEELISQADFLAQVSTAALEFEDQPNAESTLARLVARPNVHAAAIYRADGSLFVSYASAVQRSRRRCRRRAGRAPPASASPDRGARRGIVTVTPLADTDLSFDSQ